MRFNAYLDDVEALTKYLSKTIGDFMNFFNTNKPKELFSLNELIVEMKSIINKRLKSIHLEVNMEDNILLEGYRSELLQVLLIIINNAIDACLSESEDRNFKIKLDIEESKEYLKIRVFNNGGNIPQVILDKIFDPYFTTKHQSKGTGLGLYILKMIVEQRMLGEVKIDNFKEGIVVELNIPWSKRILED